MQQCLVQCSKTALDWGLYDSSLKVSAMKTTTLSIAAALTLLASTAAFAGELPSYEANGFPASPLQVRVLGAAHLEQQAAAPAAISPAQASVLTPRKTRTANAAATTGAAR